jgi:hypothetical protein
MQIEINHTDAAILGLGLAYLEASLKRATAGDLTLRDRHSAEQQIDRITEIRATLLAAIGAEAERPKVARISLAGEAVMHRSVAIVAERAENGAWGARAGGRSVITSHHCGSRDVAVDNAITQIDDGFVCASERVALWINDTTHWEAAQRAAGRG